MAQLLPRVTRRTEIILILISASIPFTFVFVWLLSLPPQLAAPHGHDHAASPGQGHDTATDGKHGTTNPSTEHDPTDYGTDSNTVRSSTGFYQGKLNGNFDNVLEFLNVPYGHSTAGKNRFMPPVSVKRSNKKHDATKFGKACPQYVPSNPSIWSEQIPWYRNIPSETTGESAHFAGEDCLSLAIWTPANAKADSNLPVAVFLPGGGFQKNGVLVPAHQPEKWVSRSQSHIVVTVNYRLSIMGFPNAAGVNEQNLGLLDQRLALEWVRDNIDRFGGNPSKILLWGFSAGAQSVDFHNYAYFEDPIAHAHFAQSGSCLAFGSGKAEDSSKFTFVAKNIGCDYPADAAKELECMQKADYNAMINFVGRHSGQPRLHFGPVTDGRTVFADYRERYKSGKVTKAPMIYSFTANDGGSLAPYPADDPDRGPDQDMANGITKRIMCGAAESAALRHGIGLSTYRYQYAGNWSNQDPLPWMGAYHSSDLVMLFGTYDNGDEGSMEEPLEAKTSEAMGDFLLSFMRDPHNGPPLIGWPSFDPDADNGGMFLQFGAGGQVVRNISANDVESICSGQGTYDPFP